MFHPFVLLFVFYSKIKRRRLRRRKGQGGGGRCGAESGRGVADLRKICGSQRGKGRGRGEETEKGKGIEMEEARGKD